MPNLNMPFTPQNYTPFAPAQQVPQVPPAQNNNYYVVVPSEEIVYNYPVAPNNCITFKIEGQNILMEKSMGASQFDTPKIKRYKIVEDNETTPVHIDALQEVWDAINEIKTQLEPNKARRKKDVGAGDDE